MANLLLALIALNPVGGLPGNDSPPGQLSGVDSRGVPSVICPLKRTSVVANISGFASEVTVTQTFVNPSKTPIEAIYTFPLPANAAVNRMRIQTGGRVIEGSIRRRDEARRIYEAARNQGQTAALLDQERPNVFSQSVANIVPGKDVKVEITYVEILKFDSGEFEFSFPMVVGPRYLGDAPDPDKISPPIAPLATRTGTNIDVTVNLDAGAPVESISSLLHPIDQRRLTEQRVRVALRRQDEIPNRDFILRYRTANDAVQGAFVTDFDTRKGGFFSLVLIPPKAPVATQISPREMIFVMDQSGSQSGLPIQKSRELTLKLMDTLRPSDTFNVFGFNTEVRSLFERPVSPTLENLQRARDYVRSMEANGGTNILEGLNSAILPPKDPERLRMVILNTDGYVGNEPEILANIRRNCGSTRIFTFGIGNSVNRYLIEGMSHDGRGAAEIVTLNANADASVARFVQRTQSPVLTDVGVAFEGLEVTDVTPRQVPDVFSQTPIVIHGRYETPTYGTIRVTGTSGTTSWSKAIPVHLASQPGSAAIRSLWARSTIDDLQASTVGNAEAGDPTEAITRLALEFGLMTQTTSFVAVEPRVVNVGGKPRTIRVPVEMADGVQADSMPRGMFRGAVPGAAPGGFGGGGPAPLTHKALELASGLVGSNRDRLEARPYEQKVPEALRKATGKLAVMVWLDTFDEATIKAVKAAGMTVDVKDGTLKVVMGTISATKLRTLAMLPSVERVEALPEA